MNLVAQVTRFADGSCVDNPCAGVECGDTSFCRDGQCVFSCAGISCPFGEECIDGQCQEISCGGVVCAEGQACANETCQEDNCNPEDCEPGRVCLGGECTDNPCDGIQCPANQRCEVVDGTAQCVADWNRGENPEADMGMGGGADGGAVPADAGMDTPDSGDDPIEVDGGEPEPNQDGGTNGGGGSSGTDDGDGASGCSCDVGGDAPAPLSWLLVGLLGLSGVRIRRRRRD